MKRLILAGLLVGMITGLCLAGVWTGPGTTMTYSDDPNDGGDAGPEWMMGMAIQPVWLADEESDDPNEPNEPVESVE